MDTTRFVSPLRVDCTVFRAHGRVATPWNGIAIPRTARSGRGCKAAKAATATLSMRLALHPKNRTLHPVQLPILG